MRFVHTILMSLVGLALACGSSDDSGAPTTVVPDDAGGTAEDGSKPPGADAQAPTPVTCEGGVTDLTLRATADTTITDYCLGTVCYGGLDSVQVGRQSAESSTEIGGLVRFAVPAADMATVFGATVSAVTLVLHARPNCNQCGNGFPTRAGTIAVYPLRNDWEELNPTPPACGVDRCHRTGGAGALGWGTSGSAAGPQTGIQKDVDYLSPPSTQTLTDAAETLEVPIPLTFLQAFDGKTKGALSFYLEAAVGRIMFASRETGGGAEAELRVTHCR